MQTAPKRKIPHKAGFFRREAGGFLQLLALFHCVNQVAVTGFFHLGERDEFQAGAVDAVAQAALVLRAVREDVAEVGVRDAASDFGAVHVVAGVVVFGDDRTVDRLGEARPAAAGLEFVGRAEERFAADHVHVQARREEVIVFVAEGAFGRAVLRDLIGLRVQLFFQFGSVGLVVFRRVNDRLAVGVGFRRRRRGGSGFFQRDVGLADVNVAVAVRVLGEVVLVVFLGFVEVVQRQVFDDQRFFVFFLFLLDTLK